MPLLNVEMILIIGLHTLATKTEMILIKLSRKTPKRIVDFKPRCLAEKNDR